MKVESSTSLFYGRGRLGLFRGLSDHLSAPFGKRVSGHFPRKHDARN